MSKVATNMAARLLAHDLAPRGVALQVLHPGVVATDMFHSYRAQVGSGEKRALESAVLPLERCVELYLQRCEELTLETTGQFRNYLGEVLPW